MSAGPSLGSAARLSETMDPIVLWQFERRRCTVLVVAVLLVIVLVVTVFARGAEGRASAWQLI
jgi:hypothetical protein